MTASEQNSNPDETISTVPEYALTKRLLTKQDLDLFHRHPVYESLLQFLNHLCRNCMRLPCSVQMPLSRNLSLIMELMDGLEQLIQEHPPIEHADSRFGNLAFRSWYDAMEKFVRAQIPCWWNESQAMNKEENNENEVNASPSQIMEDLCTYCQHSFGDRHRIDYGTGHELNFLIFLWCLEQIGFFTAGDYTPLALRVFPRYFKLMRLLQFEYWLEPAGSHGVWGLDDYHFLPFMFGAAQLTDHRYIRPKSIHDLEIVHEFAKDYMYLSCIAFVNHVKTDSLAWHSPMLNDISGVKQWKKIHEGLVKMYKAEVLGKLPIMQHLFFGRMFGLNQWDTDSKNSFASFLKSTVQNRDDEGHFPAEYRFSLEWEVFDPPSGGHVPSHAPECVLFNDEMGERTQDAVLTSISNQTGAPTAVKYVQGPDGKMIPIHATHHRPAFRKSNPSQSDENTDHLYKQEKAGGDAMGQEYPTCCGHRIPSAIAAKARERGGYIPFD